jgi:hypothetical protein
LGLAALILEMGLCNTDNAWLHLALFFAFWLVFFTNQFKSTRD